MDNYEKSKLGDAVVEEKFVKDDYIIREGEEDKKFYLIEEGEAIATKSFDGKPPVKVKDYKTGDYFGERALLTSETRAANIIVTSEKCNCLSIDRECFNRLLGGLDTILKRNMEEYHKFAGPK